MELFLAWLVLASVQLAATISPGPAFAVAVKGAVIYERKKALLIPLGLGLGVLVHVMFVLFGLSVVLTQSEILFRAIKYAGAAYLIYIGIKSMRAKPRKKEDIEDAVPKAHKDISSLKAIQLGLLTNLLNPKALVFFTAVFTQFVSPETPIWMLVIYALTATLIEAGWFAGMTFVLTTQRVRAKFMAVSHWIDRVCGGLLTALGVRLALSKIAVN